jgi:hypothetical protein
MAVDQRIYPKRIEWEGGDWIFLARNSIQWWAFVNTAMNIEVI